MGSEDQSTWLWSLIAFGGIGVIVFIVYLIASVFNSCCRVKYRMQQSHRAHTAVAPQQNPPLPSAHPASNLESYPHIGQPVTASQARIPPYQSASRSANTSLVPEQQPNSARTHSSARNSRTSQRSDHFAILPSKSRVSTPLSEHLKSSLSSSADAELADRVEGHALVQVISLS